nr:MAG TPA: hypothetical protein [Caudoviricetes sp.]DAQ76442.1 MAG TPA: hypothetical protein [Bacteriophage sp.]
MKRIPLFIIWIISLAMTILFANEFNVVFWLSFVAFALCQVCIEKNKKRLEREE